MILHENHWSGRRRWLFDRLPHEVRRQIFRVREPAKWAHLQAMRKDGGLDPIFDLSTFLKRNAIFVHVPKAAGRSVRKGLFDGRTASHTTMYHYQLAFSRGEFRRMFKFGFVRNPWDRCHSAYQFLMQGGVNEWDRRNAELYLSPYGGFQNFIMEGLGTPGVMSVVHFLPAAHFLEVRPGLMPLDFIGYFEQFDIDFARVAERMGRPADDTPWENRTSHKEAGYLESYTSAMRERVAEVYRRDIELFGYSFESYAPHRLNASLPLIRCGTAGASA